LSFNPLLVKEENGYSYLIKCDSTIPQRLNNYFENMPPCSEKIFIKAAQCPAYQTDLVELYRDYISNPFNKEFLLLNLYNKKEYSVYYKNFQFYCNLGVALDKVHKVICFEEKKVFEEYVNKNIALRNEAISKAKKICMN